MHSLIVAALLLLSCLAMADGDQERQTCRKYCTYVYDELDECKAQLTNNAESSIEVSADGSSCPTKPDHDDDQSAHLLAQIERLRVDESSCQDQSATFQAKIEQLNANTLQLHAQESSCQTQIEQLRSDGSSDEHSGQLLAQVEQLRSEVSSLLQTQGAMDHEMHELRRQLDVALNPDRGGQAAQQAESSVAECDAHLDCGSCLASGCGWCLGERACVPNVPWMCQGQEDHVGSIGDHSECPKVEIPDLPRQISQEKQTEPAAPASEMPPCMKHLVGNYEGSCDDCGVTGEVLTCRQCRNGRGSDSDVTSLRWTHCAAGGEVENHDGHLVCSEFCVDNPEFDGAPDQATLEEARLAAQEKLRQRQREELLRVKLEVDEEESGSGGGDSQQTESAPDAAAAESQSPLPLSAEDKERCRMVEELADQEGVGQKDPYTVMDLDMDASLAQIRRAYRKLSRRFHPDKLPKQCEQSASAAFSELVAANEILSDPDRRAAFDDFGFSHGESFNTQWEWEMYGRKNENNMYTGSRHITNIDEKLWRKWSNGAERGKKVWLVEFYAPWCGACQRFTPTYKAVARDLAIKDFDEVDNPFQVDVEVGAINCQTNGDLCRDDFNLRAYPTVRLVSPHHGMQHEIYQASGLSSEAIVEAARNVAAEWMWLFARSNVTQIANPDAFRREVMTAEEFHVILFTDGVTCAPCRSSKTNALRLSAGLAGSGSSAVVRFFDCSASQWNSNFCTQDVGVPPPPHAPQVRGFGTGNKTRAKGGIEGELLYNANEIAPHAALRLIESVIRLSANKTESDSALSVGKEAGWHQDQDDEDEDQPNPSQGPPPFRKPAGPALQWNGPSARLSLKAGGGGGGHHNHHQRIN